EKDRDPEVYGDSRRAEEVADGLPEEPLLRQGHPAGLLLNAPAYLLGVQTGLGFDQDEGHGVALAGHVPGGLAVACIDDGKGREWRRRLADADQDAAPIVHLEEFAELIL